jgi:coenzyme F420-0:L-glutamate ligase / coenzyme F420-1:gamma-L-glutamate ligase
MLNGSDIHGWKPGAPAMTKPAHLRCFALPGVPLLDAHCDLAAEICAAIDRSGETWVEGDICVVAQKIVSKVEDRKIALESVNPDAAIISQAESLQRDPRLLALIEAESSEILRATPAAVIARHRTGHVLANAGIDASNIPGEGEVLLWPSDPDASARALREAIARRSGAHPAVLIADSMGRAWRIGTVGTAIGCAGLQVLEDRRGTGRDLYGRTLQATVIAVADSIAAMASLAMGEGDEGTPVVIVRGAGRWVTDDDGTGAVCGLRPVAQDMFR